MWLYHSVCVNDTANRPYDEADVDMVSNRRVVETKGSNISQSVWAQVGTTGGLHPGSFVGQRDSNSRALDAQYTDPRAEIEAITADYVNDPSAVFEASDGTANYAGVNWASLLADDARYRSLLIADRRPIHGT